MSELPPGWAWTTLGEVTKPKSGRLSPAADDNQPYLSLEDVESNTTKILGWRRAGDYRSTSARVDNGDVLYGRLRPYLNKVTIADRAGLASSEFIVLPPSPVASSGWLKFVLNSPQFVAWADAHSDGDRPRVKWPQMAGFSFGLPPVAEQERIVATLEERLGVLDASAVALGRARGRLATFRSRLIGSLLDLSTAPGLDEEADETPLPSGWTWVRAADACEIVASGSTPKAADLFPGAGEVPFIKVYNLGFDGRLDFTIKPTFVSRDTHEGQLRRSRLVPGDVLINIVGPPLGKVTVVPADFPEWNMNQAVASFRSGPQILSDFLAYSLMARPVIQPLVSTGKATAGQINLNISACRKLWLPVPPLSQQVTLVSRLEAAMSTWERTCTQVADASNRGGSLRRSILAAAVSGQLLSQDPDDEPAPSLERISCERGAASLTRTR